MRAGVPGALTGTDAPTTPGPSLTSGVGDDARPSMLVCTAGAVARVHRTSRMPDEGLDATEHVRVTSTPTRSDAGVESAPTADPAAQITTVRARRRRMLGRSRC